MENLPVPYPTNLHRRVIPSDQRSVDRETLLSEDVYFDYEPDPRHLQLLTDLELGNDDLEAEIEFLRETKGNDPGEEKEDNAVVVSAIEQHIDIDTVSELSAEDHLAKMAAMYPLKILTAENLAKMHQQQGTPMTVRSDPSYGQFPDLDEVKVTAYNSEGLNIANTKPKKKNKCLLLALLLVVVTAISLGIGISQGRRNGRSVSASASASELDVLSTSPPTVSAYPSVSPTVEHTGITLDPTSNEATNAPSIPEDVDDISTIMPSARPSVTTEVPETATPTIESTTKKPTSSPTPKPTSIPETAAPTSESTTETPTPSPMRRPTRRPTPEPTPSPTPEPSTRPPTLAPTAVKPTPSPTPKPTSNPTSAPVESLRTESPTEESTESETELSTSVECITQIATGQSCYTRGAPVEVFFDNCDPKPSDWIGLYRNPNDLGSNNLDAPRIWVFACGTRECREQVSSNRIIFSIDWLPEGTYGTVLARYADAAPYPVLATHTFTVASSCS
ncbi:allergen V5/Tpx-1-like protein [Nitzschia inconspicua]|uniref:Allergen V5/Tpx-1-like protein n=1 Tax=Nitzschia inconspicua TaxID=303405 RepID=A0A9K3LWU4_9STRA|nr:allergen V5/Tpx-1-like protein [Nitzschia inconspicua]